MTRVLRFGGIGLAVIVTLLGCSESHTIDVIDSGSVAVVDGSIIPRDTGTPIDAFVPPRPDTGVITPDEDASVITPDDDAGIVMPPIDSSVVTPGDDAGIVTPGDDASVMPPVDAGPGGVNCGGATCVDPQICCVSFGGGMTSMACTARDACMGVTATCDGPEDCSTGEACCAMGGPGGGGGSTGCVADAMCRFGRLCHADSECTGRDTCCSFMGASICSPFCP